MKFRDELRDKQSCSRVCAAIADVSRKPLTLMEVCGGHTMAVHRFGILGLLPPTVRLVSGPGCPVCVSSRRFIDHALALARRSDTIIATYGDLIRVPGSTTTLEAERGRGADVRIVYSTLDALHIASVNRDKKVVFLGIGFETTAPASAAALVAARRDHVDNFFLLSSHKVMPPAMRALIDAGVAIDGYICPGHVSVVTGSAIYDEFAQRYGRGCVITGFEPLDILLAVYMLVRQMEEGRPSVEIEYKRAVRPEGNLKARRLMEQVFVPRDDWWRGLGVLPASGLGVGPDFAAYDAEKAFAVDIEPTRESPGCICGDILRGVKTTTDCPLFEKVCTPANPVGACMVSSEGACAAWYRYGRTAA
jgi:hydrogenase expression/formation protein HypD